MSPLPDPDGPAEAPPTVDVIDPIVDLGVSVSDNAFAVVAGTVHPFTIRAVNHGPAIAHDVVVTAAAPATTSVESVDVFPSDASCDVAGRTVTCELASLADEGTITQQPVFQISVALRILTTDTPIQIPVSVTSATPEVQPDPTPNSVTGKSSTWCRGQVGSQVWCGAERYAGGRGDRPGLPAQRRAVVSLLHHNGLRRQLLVHQPSPRRVQAALQATRQHRTGDTLVGDAADRTTATPVVFAGLSESVVVDVELPYVQPPSVVSGTVTKSPFFGMAGYGVWAYRSTDLYAPTDAVAVTTVSPSSGSFTFSALLSARTSSGSCHRRDRLPVRWAGGVTRSDATAYQVLGDGAPVTVAPIHLGPAATSLAGTVTDAA